MHAHAFGVEARDDAFRVVVVGAAALRRRDELVPRVHGVAMQREHECSWLRARAVGGGCQPQERCDECIPGPSARARTRAYLAAAARVARVSPRRTRRASVIAALFVARRERTRRCGRVPRVRSNTQARRADRRALAHVPARQGRHHPAPPRRGAWVPRRARKKCALWPTAAPDDNKCEQIGKFFHAGECGRERARPGRPPARTPRRACRRASCGSRP